MAAPNTDTGEVSRSDFPAGFVIGVATSAYQVEGATNKDGKGDSIWDVFSKTNGNIKDGSNGDIAVDQYHRYKEDVELIAKLGFEAYRFSISWSRIFPDGFGNKINEKGIAYYNDLIDYLLKKGIQPYATLYHWDLPYNLHESEGGWLSEKIVFLDPIFYGDYPAAMRERLGDHLPHFTQRDKELLRNAIDFIGLNHYTSRLISHASATTEGPFYEVQELERIVKWQGGELIGERAASDWLYIVPWGLRKVLNYIAQKYKNPPIYITENGMDDEENETAALDEFLNDEKRVKYFKRYLGAVAQAIRDGADVRGYFAWSLLDNFEWAQGYTKRFGLVYVDYKNGLKRHPKSSALWFSHFLKPKN